MSLKVTTDQVVDSVHFSGKACGFERISDSIVKVEIDFNNISDNENEIALYSKKRIYKTGLSVLDIKPMLSSEYQNRGQITMMKKQCTILTIDGYSVHRMGSLIVSTLKKEKLIMKECCGVYRFKESLL